MLLLRSPLHLFTGMPARKQILMPDLGRCIPRLPSTGCSLSGGGREAPGNSAAMTSHRHAALGKTPLQLYNLLSTVGRQCSF